MTFDQWEPLGCGHHFGKRLVKIEILLGGLKILDGIPNRNYAHVSGRRAGIVAQHQQRAKSLLLVRVGNRGAYSINEFVKLVGGQMELRHARVHGFFLPGGKLCKIDGDRLRSSRVVSKAVFVSPLGGVLAALCFEALGALPNCFYIRLNAMETYLIGPFLAFLPLRWRARFSERKLNWTRATILSGLLEGLVAFVALVVWYSIYVTRIGEIIHGAGGQYSGYVGLFALAVHPLTWVICYFGCEAAGRVVAAVATEESHGTLPLWLMAWGLQKLSAQPRLQPIADKVGPGPAGSDLEVASCRPKDNWKYPLAIRYQDKFFQVTGQERKPLSAPRPYVYFLRRLPSDEIIKGLESYDPNVIPEDQPGFFKTVLTEIRRPK